MSILLGLNQLPQSCQMFEFICITQNFYSVASYHNQLLTLENFYVVQMNRTNIKMDADFNRSKKESKLFVSCFISYSGYQFLALGFHSNSSSKKYEFQGMRQSGCSGFMNPQIFGTSPFEPADFEACSTIVYILCAPADLQDITFCTR